ncbi:MAG: hypothetical protein ACFFG0_29970 [Candidatus Thorarchaeota archaeon]
MISFVINIINTSPPGDALDHNAVIAMIIDSNRYPTTNAPIDPHIPFNVLRYPQGFRTLGVIFTLLFFSYPLHVTPILAGSISALIPIITFNAIFLRCRSIVFASFGFFFSILIPFGKIVDPHTANDLTLGNLIVGTYPQHLVVLEIIGLYSLLIFFNEKNDKKIPLWGILVILSFFSLGIFITSYQFIIFIIALIFFIVLNFTRKKIFNLMRRKTKNQQTIIIFIISSMVVVLLFSLIFVYPYFSYILNRLFSVEYFRFKLDIEMFFSNTFGILIICSFILIILKILRQKTLNHFDLFYLIIFTSTISTLIYYPITYHLIIFPIRCFMPLAGISIIGYFSDLEFYSRELCPKFHKKLDKKYKSALFIIVFGFSFYNTMPYLNFMIVSPPIPWSGDYDWWNFKPGSDDYKVVEWINHNIDKNKLILNDPSYAGLYILTFTYRNVVFFRQLSMWERDDGDLNNTFYAQRTYECMSIFQDPLNFNKSKEIIQKYNISFIFISSSNLYFDYINRESKTRSPFSSEELIEIYNQSSYLKLKYIIGNSAVYISNI